MKKHEVHGLRHKALRVAGSLRAWDSGLLVGKAQVSLRLSSWEPLILNANMQHDLWCKTNQHNIEVMW